MTERLEQIPEKLLARLWKERASRERSFRSADGRRFWVIYPGRLGTTAGPDFRDAVLEEEGVGLVTGDVEVHVRSRDWKSHGHGRDPRYNGVVLHVVSGPGGPPTTLKNGNRVPVVSLAPLLETEAGEDECPGLWPLLGAHGYLAPHDPAEMGAILDRAGESRFLQASESFLRLLREEDPEQVLYAALMEALGYSQNRDPFQELAHRVNYRTLAAAVAGYPSGVRIGPLQEILLREAGFPAPVSLDAMYSSRNDVLQPPRVYGGEDEGGGHPPSQETGRSAEARRGGPSAATRRGSRQRGGSPRVRPMEPDRWHLFRVRPENHPRRRILGFAHVLDTFLPSPEAGHAPWAGAGLVQGVIELLKASSDSARGGRRRRRMEAVLMGTCGCTSRASCGGKAGAPIGRGGAADMVVNCVLPYVHAIARLRDEPPLERLAWEAYCVAPRLQENELTREMWRQLFRYEGTSGAWASVVPSARRQQGLLHLHQLLRSPAVTTVR